MTRTIFVSPSAHRRRSRAVAWLAARGPSTNTLILGASVHAAASLRRQATQGRATLGWTATSLLHLTGSLARADAASEGRIPAAGASLEALCTRLIHEGAAHGRLGRFGTLADRPGLPRALARTLRDLRLAGIEPAAAPEPFQRLLEDYEALLADHGLADERDLLRWAAGAVARRPFDAVVLLDLPCASRAHRDLLDAVLLSANAVLALVPEGDEEILEHWNSSFATLDRDRSESASQREDAVRRLFQPDLDIVQRPEDGSIVIFSASNESLEAVEIARRIAEEADAGTPYERQAVAVHEPTVDRALVLEALRRADIPAWSGGTRGPDPSGRALLTLLAVREENLSARRFAEYLSLGQVPQDVEGRPPPASEPELRFRLSDDPLLDPVASGSLSERPPEADGCDAKGDPAARDPETAAVIDGTLRVPRRWERMLVEAAVIGGLDRWRRRLDGLAAEWALQSAAVDPDAPHKVVLERRTSELAALREFALPLLEDLVGLPSAASFGTWLDHLEALATRALREPTRVLEALAELRPMASVGPMTLTQVRVALETRLKDLTLRIEHRPNGCVFVGPPSEFRGLEFDVVFVPGLAERSFPAKVLEDPLLLDLERAALPGVPTNEQRVEAERSALRLALQSARRCVLSWPRLSGNGARVRVPSFYGLEVLRAKEGVMAGHRTLALRAAPSSGARLAWPAPRDPARAIDVTEYDLAALAQASASSNVAGAMRYLMTSSPTLARALRARWLRHHSKKLTSYDGLVLGPDDLPEPLARHALEARSYSPTALERLSACPYQFALQAIFRLERRKEPVPLESLDPLSRGSLIHEVLFDVLQELGRDGRHRLRPEDYESVRPRLDAILDRVAAKYEDELAPAIERVFRAAVEEIRVDLREWLRRQCADERWTPAHMELSFGLDAREQSDARSVRDPVALECGIRLRGSIDLLEESMDGSLRATDYKTGKARSGSHDLIAGGTRLQPLLYALAAERIFPERKVEAGRLYYCTHRGGYAAHDVPLDEMARNSAQFVGRVIGHLLDRGTLPAAPSKGACTYCDFLPICGPGEEQRVARKALEPDLMGLRQLRELP